VKAAIFLLLGLFCTGQSAHGQKRSVRLDRIEGEYKSLTDLKPVLVNDTDQSIYLLPEDCGQAQLWLHYMNRNWMQGISKDCFAEETINEIKPGATYQIPTLIWRPLRTYDGNLIERTTFPGLYRIVMRYSFKRPPDKPLRPYLKSKAEILMVSKEFTLVP
jgi:hypothetical protein